ncbi:MAG: ABC transporter permease [Patescibacteria group bacterium]|nr:ABC transporter permease [Patescibacteria group bacterium]
MRFSELSLSAYQSLLRTKGRSIMTMFGIVIGIAAVILALSIGESAKAFILSQISSFGSDQLVITNGPREDTSGGPSFFVQETLTMKDYKRLDKETWIKAVSGEIFQTDLIQANGQNMNGSVIGTLPDEIAIGGYETKDGFFISSDQVDSHARVAVIGYGIADNFFGQENPIGKSIKLGNNGFRVIGVMEKLGTQFFQNLDQMVYIPATTMMDVYGKDHFTDMLIQVTIDLGDAQARTEDILRDMHNIDNPTRDYSKDDFHVVSQEEAIKVVSQITDVLEILLAAIAAISLLVGGIGIMNIMFVSVTERIKEIGLRKAIGARRNDVLNQFLAEAVILTVLGGVAGIILGSSVAWLAIQIISYYQTGWTFTVSLTGVIVGVVVSTLIGLIFGYVPARRAAKLHPIDALRAND